VWDKKNERHQPSALLLKDIAMLVMDNMIKGCMIREGTLLIVPDRDLDEVLQERRPSNALDIKDLREVPINWTSTNNMIESLHQWVDGSMNVEKGGAPAAGNKTDPSPSSSEEEEMTDDMDSTPTGTTISSMGGSPVWVSDGNSAFKPPGYE